ncbi:MAG TPA: response regulator [Candidatus Saccharimonadales bacterium]
MKIVLLEPDKVLADTYRQALMHAGHKVVMCASAQAAIFAADEMQPDLVVMELQLAGHSGIEFLYEFRSYDDWCEVPVIVLTNVPAGEFDGSWELLRSQLNVHTYHYKPLTSLRTLLRSVDAVRQSAAI